jgi:phosphotransferase system  glucose/maltose/N-acetylglucosamine-specific IIC component
MGTPLSSMNGTRLTLFILGLAMVLVAAIMLFFATGLNEWVPMGIAGAGLLLLIGLLVIGFSENARRDVDVGPTRTERVERIDEHHHH